MDSNIFQVKWITLFMMRWHIEIFTLGDNRETAYSKLEVIFHEVDESNIGRGFPTLNFSP